jgi:hypothetical protein
MFIVYVSISMTDIKIKEIMNYKFYRLLRIKESVYIHRKYTKNSAVIVVVAEVVVIVVVVVTVVVVAVIVVVIVGVVVVEVTVLGAIA